jgi:hypothetical protein
VNAHDQQLARAVALLQQAPAIAGGRVYRGRRRPLAESAASGVFVYFRSSLPDRSLVGGGAPLGWQTVFTIESIARATASQSGDEAALQLNGQVFERLMTDPTLGGAAQDLAPGPIDSDEEELDTAIGVVVAQFATLHRTSSTTLEV